MVISTANFPQSGHSTLHQALGTFERAKGISFTPRSDLERICAKSRMNSPADDFSFDPEGVDFEQEKLEKAKSKLIMDFGLEQPKLERVNLEVLKQLIREKPDRMSRVIRTWLRPGGSNQ